jgi:aerobic carbon-monoxide dehydrogenase large subunit
MNCGAGVSPPFDTDAPWVRRTDQGGYMPKDGGIGASTKRREDVRFLTGKGRYTDDINIRGQLYAHFMRSTWRMGGSCPSTPPRPPRCRAWPVFTAADFAGVGGNPAAGR